MVGVSVALATMVTPVRPGIETVVSVFIVSQSYVVATQTLFGKGFGNIEEINLRTGHCDFSRLNLGMAGA